MRFHVKLMRYLCLSALLLSGAIAYAEESSVDSYEFEGQSYFNPVQDVQINNLSRSLELLGKFPGSSPSVELSYFETPANFRVQIFPHWGRYSTPQGRESDPSSFSLKSSGICQVTDSPDSNWRARVIRSGSTLHFSTASVKSPVWVSCSQSAQLIRGGKLAAFEYKGIFEIKPAVISGVRALRVILHLNFEDYIRGVIPSEMPSSWHPEALRAQAIAARTYALYQVYSLENQILAADYDVDDTILYQAFLGESRTTASTNRAARETEGMVLTYGGEPLSAFFSSDSGGYTELTRHVWNTDLPYCPTQPEYYDLKLVKSAWTVSQSAKFIQNALTERKMIVPSRSQLSHIDILERSPSGRALVMLVHFLDGSSQRISGLDFQRAMRLRSNLFELTRTQDGIRIDGRGFGHGVGMNQFGAKVLAEHYGWTAEQILLFYFR